MDPPPKPGDPKESNPVSRHLPGPPFLRHYPAHKLIAWQPRGTFDDALLDQMAEWLVSVEKAFIPFKRYIDLSQLEAVAITTHHLLEFARKRAEQFPGTVPVRTALFCEEWVGFGIARLYESLMADTLIEARAFRDRAGAAEWLDVPANILELTDEPAARNNRPA